MERRARRRDPSAHSSHNSCQLPPAPGPQSSTGGSGDSPRETYISQLEEYSGGLENEYAELRTRFDHQAKELKGMCSLLEERKLHEEQCHALENKVAQHERFLVELMPLLCTEEDSDLSQQQQRLRPSKDLNRVGTPQQQRGKKGMLSSLKGVEGEKGVPVSLDAVRDAAQKQHLRFKGLLATDAKQMLAIRALEKELVNVKKSVAAAAHKSSSSSSLEMADVSEDCYVPGTAKELAALRLSVKSLERKLTHAERDTRAVTSNLKRAEMEVKTLAVTIDRQKAELETAQRQLLVRDRLLAAAEKRAVATEEAAAAATSLLTTGDAAATNAAKLNVTPVRPSNSRAPPLMATPKGSLSSCDVEKLVSTRHLCVFPGPGPAHLLRMTPEVFKDVFVRTVSALLHVPYGYVSNVEMRSASADAGVTVEADVRHDAKLSEADVDALMESCPFADMEKLKEEALQAEIAAASTLARQLQETRRSLESKREHLVSVQKRIGVLEASLERRDVEQERFDREVSEALGETESTIRSLCSQLEEQQAELAECRTQLAACQSALKSAETKAAALEKDADCARKAGTRHIEALEKELSQVKEDATALVAKHASVTEALVAEQQRSDELEGKLAVAAEVSEGTSKAMQSTLAAVQIRLQTVLSPTEKRAAEAAGHSNLTQLAEAVAARISSLEKSLRLVKESEKELRDLATTRQTQLTALQKELADLSKAHAEATATAQSTGDKAKQVEKSLQVKMEELQDILRAAREEAASAGTQYGEAECVLRREVEGKRSELVKARSAERRATNACAEQESLVAELREKVEQLEAQLLRHEREAKASPAKSENKKGGRRRHWKRSANRCAWRCDEPRRPRPLLPHSCMNLKWIWVTLARFNPLCRANWTRHSRSCVPRSMTLTCLLSK